MLLLTSIYHERIIRYLAFQPRNQGLNLFVVILAWEVITIQSQADEINLFFVLSTTRGLFRAENISQPGEIAIIIINK